jgi:hypothetical protein
MNPAAHETGRRPQAQGVTCSRLDATRRNGAQKIASRSHGLVKDQG